MPYQVIKSGAKYQLKNKNTKRVVAKKFNTKSSAKKAGVRYHNYAKKKKK
tara:strand:- start:1004 stop:1153 length:150 start_codon:yes stop_codon:yes gene_type:complete